MIVVVPAAAPVKRPVALSIVATPVLLLLHVPLTVASLKGITSPAQIVELPDIATGNGLTVAVINALHPAGVT